MSVKIAISGDLGSGKSTIGRLFESRLGLKFHSGGSIFRSLATKYNMTPAEFSKYSEIHPEIWRLIPEWHGILCRVLLNCIY